MKTPLTLGAAACAMLLLASCASPIQHRIQKNPDLYGRLSEHQKEMVQHGVIEEGMGKEAVFLAWGKPDRVSNGSKMGKSYDRWSYAGFDPVFYGPYAPGYGPWNYDPYYNLGPAVSYLPYEERWAEFLSNHVSAWSITK